MTDLEKSGQKITIALLATQSLVSASIIIISTVASILVVQLAGNNSQWLGVPSTLSLAGAALIAYPIGRFMDKTGRRLGLALGHILGGVGAGVAGLAVVQESLAMFLVGVFLLGLAKGAIDLGRYAAAEANPLSKRARAVSLVVLGGTVGSIAGPALIKWTGVLAQGAGLPALSGPWFIAGLFFLIAWLIVTLFLRPDPQIIARQLAATTPGQPVPQQQGRTFQEILRGDDRAKLAISALVFGQLTMVWVMTVTPVHMHHSQHDLSAISWVMMAHTLGMFGLSFLVGSLVDRLGRSKMIMLGGLLLIGACLLAPLSTESLWLMLVLFLLGLGWNCCFVAGSTLLADTLRPYERGQVQGLADVLVNVASGAGSLGSGLLFAATGFAAMAWAGLIAAIMPVLLVILLRTAVKKVPLEGMV